MILKQEKMSFPLSILLHWQKKGSRSLSITSLNVDNEFSKNMTTFFPDFIIHMHVLALLTANCKTPEQLYTSHCGPPVGQKPEEHRLRTITFVNPEFFIWSL